jgi:hypothetical protein
MANSITIHSEDDSGNSFEITLKKTGPDTGAIEIKKLNPPLEDHPFDVSGIRANKEGTKIVCKANVIFSPEVTCFIDKNTPGSPSIVIDVSSFVSIHEKFEIKPSDFAALTQFVIKAGFPWLN